MAVDRTKANRFQNAVRAYHIRRGLCRDCAAPAAPGRAQCQRHLALGAASAKRTREKKKALVAPPAAGALQSGGA